MNNFPALSNVSMESVSYSIPTEPRAKARNGSTKTSRRGFREQVELGPKKRPWTGGEDRALLACLQQISNKESRDIKWTEISKDIRGRNGKQCRERWYNHLRPDLKKGDWTIDEDEKVALLQQKYGNAWAKISAELGNRTDNDVKNRWHSHKRSAEKNRRKMAEYADVSSGCNTESLGIFYQLDHAAWIDIDASLYNQALLSDDNLFEISPTMKNEVVEAHEHPYTFPTSRLQIKTEKLHSPESLYDTSTIRHANTFIKCENEPTSPLYEPCTSIDHAKPIFHNQFMWESSEKR